MPADPLPPRPAPLAAHLYPKPEAGWMPLLAPPGKARKHSIVNGATLSTKGQWVIPHRFRKALHLEAGQKVTFSLEGDRLILQRELPKRARLVQGKFGRPVLVAPPGAPAMTPERVRAVLNELP